MKPPRPPLDEAPWEPPPLASEAIDPKPAPDARLGIYYGRAEVPMTCGVHNRRFIVVAEARGDMCFFVENRLSSAVLATRGAFVCEPAVSALFKRFDAHPDWRCPHCGARDNPALETHLVWYCFGLWPVGADCQNHISKMMCAGSIGRESYCACGYFAERNFTGPEPGEPYPRKKRMFAWDMPLADGLPASTGYGGAPGHDYSPWSVYGAPLGSPVANDGHSGFFLCSGPEPWGPRVLWLPP
jgi:hypothetical protein